MADRENVDDALGSTRKDDVKDCSKDDEHYDKSFILWSSSME